MKKYNHFIASILCILLVSCENYGDYSNIKIFPDGTDPDNTEGTRDPYLQPFSSYSIWNMPIGSNAKYVDAQLEVNGNFSVRAEEEYIILTPEEPLLPVYVSNAAWNTSDYSDRCGHTDRISFYAPIPKDLRYDFTDQKNGNALWWANACVSILKSDGVTLIESQPFAKCSMDEATTGPFGFSEVNIYGDGIKGSHGGSGLSAIGGTLRIHELTPTSGPIPHALKIDVYATRNLYYDVKTKKGYRWPAVVHDNSATDEINGYGKKRTTPVCEECKMGALLALPNTVQIEDLKLKTKPAQIIAQAFQDYGAYIVDDTAMDNVFCISIENSPNGRFLDEFKKNWGFDFQTSDTGSSKDWEDDLKIIFQNLHVIDNNAEGNVGGGGDPRKPLADKLKRMD